LYLHKYVFVGVCNGGWDILTISFTGSAMAYEMHGIHGYVILLGGSSKDWLHDFKDRFTYSGRRDQIGSFFFNSALEISRILEKRGKAKVYALTINYTLAGQDNCEVYQGLEK
jgi:hypothetical protein